MDDVKWKRKQTDTGGGEVIAASSGAVAASASLDDVRAAFYESLGPAQMWWWIRQVLISPQQLVVDDDAGGLWTIDFTVDATSDTVTFGDPTAVKVEYVAAAKQHGMARPGQLVASVYASAEQAGARPRATISDVSNTDDAVPEGIEPEGENTNPPEKEKPEMQLTPELLASVGLAADATEAEFTAAVIARGQSTPPSEDDGNANSQPETPATEPTAEPATAPEGGQVAEPPAAAPTVPEGALVVDKAAWEETQQFIAASRASQAKEAAADQERHIAAAALAGKIPASRVEHYRGLMKADPEGTKQVLASLSPGLIPVVERGTGASVGAGSDSVAAATDASYPEGWKPTVKATARRVGVNTRIINAHDNKAGV